MDEALEQILDQLTIEQLIEVLLKAEELNAHNPQKVGPYKVA